ncbi:somatomedin-B and thrombospondin type-1 domain-containing protein-like [Actinia tenebrosa]|uniref:Somatomedin-B and thrombospondin type-1 domain-containing protein-like n=1 Tax=Actinia tenebrosa TaxID=6105 RepID=A0A6P8IXS7_ACTTE|nr:somatomedin-B and thrombospondin type-1 domain-containing protein-like [Actinia tenebrosa]
MRAVWGFVLLCSLAIGTLVSGQCDQRQRGGPLICCSGRNSTCAAERYENDEKDQPAELRRKVCFCDAFCEPAGDCCPDFERVKEECKIKGVRDCVVSTWSRWTSCSHDCGVGTRKRHREVIVKPSEKGGKLCPPLREKRGCFLKHCGERSGLAHILPKKFKRLPSKYESILPKRKDFEEEEKPKRKSYCMFFKIESKHPYCKGTWARDLDPRKPTCVECQDSAMDENGDCKGHGVVGEITSWVAVDIYSCHGEWLRLGPMVKSCECNTRRFNNFIFV